MRFALQLRAFARAAALVLIATPALRAQCAIAVHPGLPAPPASCAGRQDECIDRSYGNVFGRAPTPQERAYWRQQSFTYTFELIARHLEWLGTPAAAGELEAMVQRVARHVYGRAATNPERANWAARFRDGEGYAQMSDSLTEQLYDTEFTNPERRSLINRAFMTAHGRIPTVAEANAVPECLGYDMVVTLRTAYMYSTEGQAELTNTLRRAWRVRHGGNPTSAQIGPWIVLSGSHKYTFDTLKTIIQ